MSAVLRAAMPMSRPSLWTKADSVTAFTEFWYGTTP